MTDSKMSVDDVLDAMMLEEEKPSYAALQRWIARYPDYRNQLTDYYATWLEQDYYAKHAEPTRIDEEKLTKRGLEYAMEILRRQGRVVPEGTIETLRPFDQLVLSAVRQLQGEAYSGNVTQEVSKVLGRRTLLASTFKSLDSLEERGLVLARRKAETRYYTVTVIGETALAHAPEPAKAIADFLGGIA